MWVWMVVSLAMCKPINRLAACPGCSLPFALWQLRWAPARLKWVSGQKRVDGKDESRKNNIKWCVFIWCCYLEIIFVLKEISWRWRIFFSLYAHIKYSLWCVFFFLCWVIFFAIVFTGFCLRFRDMALLSLYNSEWRYIHLHQLTLEMKMLSKRHTLGSASRHCAADTFPSSLISETDDNRNFSSAECCSTEV